MPKRIQRKRTKGWRMPPDTIYVGRGTLYGNPYTMADESQRDIVIQRYRHRLNLTRMRYPESFALFLKPLRGKNLACFCPAHLPCHADILLEFANE